MCLSLLLIYFSSVLLLALFLVSLCMPYIFLFTVCFGVLSRHRTRYTKKSKSHINFQFGCTVAIRDAVAVANVAFAVVAAATIEYILVLCVFFLLLQQTDQHKTRRYKSVRMEKSNIAEAHEDKAAKRRTVDTQIVGADSMN